LTQKCASFKSKEPTSAWFEQCCVAAAKRNIIQDFHAATIEQVVIPWERIGPLRSFELGTLSLSTLNVHQRDSQIIKLVTSLGIRVLSLAHLSRPHHGGREMIFCVGV
jgi:hypothetical protein